MDRPTGRQHCLTMLNKVNPVKIATVAFIQTAPTPSSIPLPISKIIAAHQSDKHSPQSPLTLSCNGKSSRPSASR